MTTLSKDEIMAMVDKAGFEHKNHLTYRGRYNKCTVPEKFEIDCFERFATLCRADLVAENERLIAERHLYAQSIAGMNEAMDALKADAEQWRAYKSRKDAVIAAGMGCNPLRKEAK